MKLDEDKGIEGVTYEILSFLTQLKMIDGWCLH